MESRPLLIIFGAGYLGGYLGIKAMEKGWRVMGLTRNRSRADELLEMGFEKVVVEELDSPDWWSAFKVVPDHVVNCVSSAGGGLEGYRKSYIQGNQSILKWVRRHEEKESFRSATFLYTGSTGVYPDVGGRWVTEGDVDKATTERAAILQEAERVIMEAFHDYFQRWFILRLAGLYGPGRTILVDRLLKGEGKVRGGKRNYLNLIRVEDAVSAMLCSLQSEVSVANKVWNVADGAPATREELVSWLGERLRVAPPCFEEPRDGGGVKEWRGAKNRRIAIDAICRDLNWTPRYANYRDGLGPLLTSRES